MPDPRIDSIIFFIFLGIGIIYLIYILFIGAIFFSLKSSGEQSQGIKVGSMLLLMALPFLVFSCWVSKERAERREENRRFREERKEYELNAKKACELEHKIHVYKTLPKEAGIFLSVPESRFESGWTIHRYPMEQIEKYAHTAFVEWQDEKGKYKRYFNRNSATVVAINLAEKEFTPDEKLAQYHFAIEDTTTAEDKKKRMRRLSMTLKNLKSNEVIADYVSFFTNSQRIYYRRGCLSWKHTDENSDPFKYFFNQVLDDTEVQIIPNIEKNTNPSYKGFDSVWLFHEDLAVVEKGNKKGFINRQGEIVIPITFQDVTSFKEGRAMFREGQSWGVINQQGEIIVPATYEAIRPFSDGFAQVRDKGHWGLINQSGELILPTKYKEIHPFKNGFAEIETYRDGMINSQGKLILPTIYQAVYEMNHGLIKVSKDQKMGAVNANGDFVIPMAFEQIDIIDTHFTKVKNTEYWGVLNTQTGKEIIPMNYEEIYFLKDKPNIIETRRGGEKQLFRIEMDTPIPIESDELAK